MTAAANQSKVEITHAAGASFVRVTGVIDDHFQPDAFGGLANREIPVIIDLDGVTRITSFGVREWMRSLKSLATDQTFYVRVRPSIVAQFNSVNQFGGRGRIVSLYCPYLCPACDTSFDVLVDLRKNPEVATAAVAAPSECPSCHKQAEFDDIESSYFGYVAAAPPLQVPPAVEALLDGTPAKKQPFRVNKLIEDDLTILWLKGTLDKTARLKRHADGLEGRVLVVVDAVDSTTSEGLANLRELIQGPAASVFLALVPMSVARAFVAYPELIGKGSLLSCVVHTRCLACGTEGAIEVRQGDTMPPANATTCPKCGKPQRSVPWTAEDAATLKAARFAPVPVEIEAFMKSRTDWQSHTSVAGQNVPAKVDLGAAATVGSRIAGKYEVIRRIGFGGMAEVLLGRQLGVEGFEKKVVIKKILPHLAEQPSFVKMFLEEARIAARLQHGNIVQVYDLLHEGNEFYAILEFVRGGDLNVMLKISTALGESIPIEIACRLICDVSAALAAAHTYHDDTGAHKPIFHRDVSPHNVLLSMEGAVKLSDFGIAKAADSITDDTGTGVLKGKVVYMPPEAILGQGADHRADVYAATVVLYQCLTGKNPFTRVTQALSLRAVIDEAVPQIDTARPDVPRALVEIINKGMHRDPMQRYQNAADLAADLEDFLISFGKQSSSARVGAWVKDLLTRGHELAGGAATNTPSPSSQSSPSNPSDQHSGLDTMMTSVTTPARVEHRDIVDDWFEDLELKPR